MLQMMMMSFAESMKQPLESWVNNFPLSSGLLIKRQGIAMVRLYENKPLQNTFKRI